MHPALPGFLRVHDTLGRMDGQNPVPAGGIGAELRRRHRPASAHAAVRKALLLSNMPAGSVPGRDFVAERPEERQVCEVPQVRREEMAPLRIARCLHHCACRRGQCDCFSSGSVQFIRQNRAEHFRPGLGLGEQSRSPDFREGRRLWIRS